MAKHDPADIFVIAEQFRNASKFLILAREHGWQTDVAMPAVTCAAFAMELFLKCLLAMETEKSHETHDLKHLFNRLSKSSQAKIRVYYGPYLPDVKEHVERQYLLAGQPQPPPLVDFDFVLDASRRAFPLARYIYERGLPGGQGWIADGIMEAVRKTVLEAHPDWKDAHVATPSVTRHFHSF
jgi:HEPN domain-containing protein